MSIKKILSIILCVAMVLTTVMSLAACVVEPPVEETESPTEASGSNEVLNVPTSSATKKPSSSKKPSSEAEGDYDLDKFDLAKYISPIWAGEISYAESAFVREAEDGKVAPISLLYPIDEVISVRSADLKTLYVNGEDYYIDDGKIVIIPDGNIPILAYEDYIFDDSENRQTSAAGGTPINVYGQADKKFVYGEITSSNGGMSHWVIAVTYKHSAECILNVPENKSSEFKNFIDKLEAGQDVNIVSIGDSITEGWSSSGVKGKKDPFCPPYNQMVANYIQSVYTSSTVTFKNLGVSGTTTTQGMAAELLNKICENEPDLVMIAYGMNDGCSLTPATYVSQLNTIIEYLNAEYPDVCIVVVGTSLPNPEFAWDENGTNRCLKYHDQYPAALAEKEVSWAEDYNVGVADVTTMNIEMYERKVYQDLTGSNSNHPNDYMHRVYAQVILQTIFGNLTPLA